MREKNHQSLFLSAALLSLTLAGPALAQGKLSDAAAKAEAEKAGKEGERLLAAHDAPRAVAELQRAFALSKNVRFLLPLGLAYAEAERPLDALDALGRFLKDTPALPDQKRKEIGGKLQVMLDQVAASVTIEAPRENAQVKVDGRAVGTTPIEAPLRLMPGQHEIVMVPAPTDPSSGAKVIVDVKPGERKAVKLEPGPRSRFLEPQSQAPAEPAQRPATGAGVAAVEKSPPPSGGEGFQWNQIHKKWWFWTAVGGATVVVVGLAAGLGARSASNAMASGEMIPKASDWGGGLVDARSKSLLALAGSWP